MHGQITLNTDRGRRTFQVETTELGYLLTGKRGACYFAIRYRTHPGRLYLASQTQCDPLGVVVLTDEDGTLRQAKTLYGVVLVDHDGHPVIMEERQ